MKVQITRERRTGEYIARVELSRRNLLYLLEKLDENGDIEPRVCAPADEMDCQVTAEEDEAHYGRDYFGRPEDETASPDTSSITYDDGDGPWDDDELVDEDELDSAIHEVGAFTPLPALHGPPTLGVGSTAPSMWYNWVARNAPPLDPANYGMIRDTNIDAIIEDIHAVEEDDGR